MLTSRIRWNSAFVVLVDYNILLWCLCFQEMGDTQKEVFDEDEDTDESDVRKLWQQYHFIYTKHVALTLIRY